MNDIICVNSNGFSPLLSAYIYDNNRFKENIGVNNGPQRSAIVCSDKWWRYMTIERAGEKCSFIFNDRMCCKTRSEKKKRNFHTLFVGEIWRIASPSTQAEKITKCILMSNLTSIDSFSIHILSWSWYINYNITIYLLLLSLDFDDRIGLNRSDWLKWARERHKSVKKYRS